METQPLDGSRPPVAPGLVLSTLLRVAATMTAVFVTYALVPATRATTTATVVIFVLALGAFTLLIRFEIRSVLRATHPALRATEVIAVIFPIFVVAFSIIYLKMSQTSNQTFNQSLDHLSSLYFTVVTFGTVGFGDIVPRNRLGSPGGHDPDHLGSDLHWTRGARALRCGPTANRSCPLSGSALTTTPLPGSRSFVSPGAR